MTLYMPTYRKTETNLCVGLYCYLRLLKYGSFGCLRYTIYNKQSQIQTFMETQEPHGKLMTILNNEWAFFDNLRLTSYLLVFLVA